MDEEYRNVVREFFRKYRPLQKKYNLHMHMQWSEKDGGKIEIWECEGNRETRCVCNLTDKDNITCFRKAASMLEIYSWKENGREQEKRAG